MPDTPSQVRFSILRYFLLVCLIAAALSSTGLPRLNQSVLANDNSNVTSPPFWDEYGIAQSRQDLTFTAMVSNVATQACRGRCLDPHPGQFRYWYGQQNGCWIQVWRGWPEGCQHYQWYNSCNGMWDNYPNGAPHVYWTCCVH